MNTHKILALILLAFMAFSCGEDLDQTITTKAITIKGEVIDNSLRPMHNVQVSLLIDGVEMTSLLSGTDGFFEFRVDEADFQQNIIVQAYKEGYAKNAKSVKEYEDNIALIYLTMHKATNAEDCNGDPGQSGYISVSGRIIDENENPSKGIVTLEYPSGDKITAYTDRLGEWEVFVPKSERFNLVISTNCFSQLIDLYFDSEESKSGIGPVDNYRWLDEIFSDQLETDFVLYDYVVKSELREFKVSGTAVTCDGTPISNGRVVFEDFWEIPVEAGQIDLTIFDCFEIKDDYLFVVEDYGNNKISENLIRVTEDGQLDLGVVTVCKEKLDQGVINLGSETFDLVEGYLSPDFYNRYIYENELIKAPTVSLTHDAERIEIKSHAREEGNYSSQLYQYIDDEYVRSLHSNNNLTLEFSEFDFSTFYGLSRGNISGLFTDYVTQEQVDVSGQFSVYTIPDFGEYR